MFTRAYHVFTHPIDIKNMTKRPLSDEEIEQSNKRLHQESISNEGVGDQSNIDAELLKDNEKEKQDTSEETASAAAAAAAAVYGDLISAEPSADPGSMKGELKGESAKQAGVRPGRGRKAAPVTGSAEWRQQRKDSHKEVERRRRENINTAITKLSELLPVKESSKAAILARAAEYIQKLKDTENANIEKWTLQKLLSEQNVSALTTANEKLQEELGSAYKRIEALKGKLKEAGIPMDPELAALDDENEDANKN